VITLPKPAHCDPETLHAQVDSCAFGPYIIRWETAELQFEFDEELSAEQRAQLEAVVAAHDGSAAIAERAEREAKILAIQDANKALVESAREKRLRGEQMSQQELAALVDLLMFPA
jgi:hypothetical protein